MSPPKIGRSNLRKIPVHVPGAIQIALILAMKTLQISRLFCQDLAHPVFRSRRQQPTEMFVYTTDGADRVASEFDVGEIENAFRGKAISFADKLCQRLRPITDRFRANLYWIDCIAKDASQNRNQT